MSKTLIIDIPNYIEKYDTPFAIVQEKVFEHVNKRDDGYLKDYIILYNADNPTNKYVKELIDDWDLYHVKYRSDNTSPSNKEKVANLKKMVKDGRKGEALIFFEFDKKESDMSNKILLDLVYYEPRIYLSVCRLDYGKFRLL
ncbi:hypothetical protein [Oceanobacillus sp. FSL H7-0719]|uniref:hypothetical protein n=1 Tax=Oceanobacillus sp. FSL H7-0719 TaxID=2954507 RepID=UPI00324F00AE